MSSGIHCGGTVNDCTEFRKDVETTHTKGIRVRIAKTDRKMIEANLPNLIRDPLRRGAREEALALSIVLSVVEAMIRL